MSLNYLFVLKIYKLSNLNYHINYPKWITNICVSVSYLTILIFSFIKSGVKIFNNTCWWYSLSLMKCHLVQEICIKVLAYQWPIPSFTLRRITNSNLSLFTPISFNIDPHHFNGMWIECKLNAFEPLSTFFCLNCCF